MKLWDVTQVCLLRLQHEASVLQLQLDESRSLIQTLQKDLQQAERRKALTGRDQETAARPDQRQNTSPLNLLAFLRPAGATLHTSS